MTPPLDFDLDDPTLLLRDDVVADPALIRDVVGRPGEFSSNLVSLLHRAADGGLAAFPMAPFGDSIHAPLARLEARLAVERFLARTSRLALDPAAPPARRPSIFLRRHATLPVVVEKAGNA